MRAKSITLACGAIIALRAVQNHIVIYYGEDEETKVKDMKEVRAWVKKHFNEELI
jgi:hypothetical protein